MLSKKLFKKNNSSLLSGYAIAILASISCSLEMSQYVAKSITAFNCMSLGFIKNGRFGNYFNLQNAFQKMKKFITKI